MTEYKTYDDFATACCSNCTSNDWFCTGYCDTLEKGANMDFSKIQKALDRHDDDLFAVTRYIKRTKVIGND